MPIHYNNINSFHIFSKSGYPLTSNEWKINIVNSLSRVSTSINLLTLGYPLTQQMQACFEKVQFMIYNHNL